ncbi:ATPase family AAA domain-containing protein 3A-like [Apiospora saccharicola]|uniref:ATPase family AAA domain-containing protein 3A-like n=1 Tax=Apiospora saccharicola TaxID=335842 RepID=A0ABR1TKE5_9PEZI
MSAQGQDEPRVAGTPVSIGDLTPSSHPVSDVDAPQKQPSASLTGGQNEKETAARAALQDAALKLRELAATTSYDIVRDIGDIDKAISELVGERGWKQKQPAPTAPGQVPRRPAKRARPRYRNTVDVERKRPCKIQRAAMEDWPPEYFSDSDMDENDDEDDSRYVPHLDKLPVLQVFYRSAPSSLPNPDTILSEKDFKDAHATSNEREKPQRVVINSALMVKDLESICGLQLLNRPHEIIPPFKHRGKLLVNNWRGIYDALESMEKVLKAVMSAERNTTIDSQQPRPRDDHPQGVREGQDASDIKIETGPKNDADDITKADKEKLSLRINHLKLLVDFIKTDLAHLIGLGMKIRDATLVSILFEELYHLYAPGDLIINRRASVDHLHQVYAVTGGRIRLSRNSGPQPIRADEADDSPDAGIGTWTDVVIDCFRMRWDGTHIGPFRLTHRVRHYVGEKNILDLDFYPVRFRDNYTDICKTLEARGKRVVGCDGHMKYEGLTVDDTGKQPRPEPSPYFGGHGLPPSLTYQSIAGVSQGGQEIEGDVYVDMKTYYQTLPPTLRAFNKLRRVQPSSREVTEDVPGFYRPRDYHAGDHDVDEARSDEFMNKHFHLINPKTTEELARRTMYLSLLSHAVPAYEFRSREWIWVDITKVEPIDKSDKTRKRGWDDLVIDDAHRRLLESLVNNHMSPAEQKRLQSRVGEGAPTAQIDLIQGKGRGLIILLHGPPGTGKTSTAEAIAAYTGKPLYAITCGDIGLVADEVEKNLLKHTRLAEKWGCVLLLDEADVFLARRNWTDVHRNALVSVFLRRLEYYSGILFMTTNIVGLIDEAFKSRIHVVLRYDMIDKGTTGQIWKNLLQRIERDNEESNVQITFDKGKLLEFATEHFKEHTDCHRTWNARQIRNAFSTAIAMGQFDRLERIHDADLSPEEVLTSGKKSLTTIMLTRDNFRRIASITDDFERYMHSVRGDDTQKALENEQRDDNFLQQRTPQRKDYKRTAAYDGDYGS